MSHAVNPALAGVALAVMVGAVVAGLRPGRPDRGPRAGRRADRAPRSWPIPLHRAARAGRPGRRRRPRRRTCSGSPCATATASGPAGRCSAGRPRRSSRPPRPSSATAATGSARRPSDRRSRRPPGSRWPRWRSRRSSPAATSCGSGSGCLLLMQGALLVRVGLGGTPDRRSSSSSTAGLVAGARRRRRGPRDRRPAGRDRRASRSPPTPPRSARRRGDERPASTRRRPDRRRDEPRRLPSAVAVRAPRASSCWSSRSGRRVAFVGRGRPAWRGRRAAAASSPPHRHRPGRRPSSRSAGRPRDLAPTLRLFLILGIGRRARRWRVVGLAGGLAPRRAGGHARHARGDGPALVAARPAHRGPRRRPPAGCFGVLLTLVPGGGRVGRDGRHPRDPRASSSPARWRSPPPPGSVAT